MRYLLAPVAALLCIALVACDDDDDEPDATSTPTAPPATSSPAPSTPPAGEFIVIDAPAADSGVAVPFEMSGTADVFEAALTIDALGDAAGLVLCTRHLQATSGTGTPGDWSGVLAFEPPPADTPITLRAYSFSAMDGSMINLVERVVTVSAEVPDIIINSPECGASVSGESLLIEGMAQVFEAALTVDIVDAGGNVLLTRNVLAASGVELSPWSVTFDIGSLPGGFYDIVAYSHSAMDGSVINVFPVQISVGP